MKKLLKAALCCVCSLLVFTLTMAHAFDVIKASFEVGSSDSVCYTQLPISGLASDNDSIPLKEPQFVLDAETGTIPEVDLLDTAIKNFLSINALHNSVKVPTPVDVPEKDPVVSVRPNDKNDDNDGKPNFGSITLTDEYAVLKQPDGSDFIYYEQTWDAYSSYPYGINTIGSHGCGPTSMAMVVSNLAGKAVSPTYMADWAYDHGYYVNGRGAAYGYFSAASKAFGIECSAISKGDDDAIVQALKEGKYLITIVSNGDISPGRHFLLIRGITEDGKLLLGDSGKYENSLYAWDYDHVMKQVVHDRFWVFG